jgi:hypothetical protein
MHAPLILLNLNATLRTNFSVQFYPNFSIVPISLHLIEPSLQEIAVHRPMCFFQTLKAPVIATLTYNVRTFL